MTGRLVDSVVIRDTASGSQQETETSISVSCMDI